MTPNHPAAAPGKTPPPGAPEATMPSDPSEGPPPTDVVRTNLPGEPNAFVGRERDVADLRGLLQTTRAVTLCGAGGIGKTRLAVHVAHGVLAAHPGGVWLVELADIAPGGPADVVARRVAAVLGASEEDGRELAVTLADAIGDRAVLLVLDNCEHVVAECAELAGTLMPRCPRLRLVATSREPLRTAGETVWRVPPLDPGEAVRLFAERARAVRPEFAVTAENTAAVEEVGRALDGVPLALELAAARLRVLTVEQIAGRLADRFRLLGGNARTAPHRQRTLRAAIDWSHELLDDRERTLLRRLSVFTGWTLGQAERVCADPAGLGADLMDLPDLPDLPELPDLADLPGLDEEPEPSADGLPPRGVLDLLTALVDKSLVVVGDEIAGETRFRLLDSIRQYAAERLAEAGEEDTIRDRHRDCVLEAAERDGELALAESEADWAGRVALFHRCDAELGNIRAALAWALDREDVEGGLRICTALRSYWIARGRVAEWAQWTDRFLARSRGLPAIVLGPALAGRAQLALSARDFPRAAGFAERALDPCRRAGDGFMAAASLITLAEAHTRAGRYTEAADRLDEADALTDAPGQEWNRGYAHIARGYMLARSGRMREASLAYESGLDVMRDIGQLWGAAHALIGLGRIAELRGDASGARARFTEALPALVEIEARPELARALAGLGRVALATGDAPLARRSLARALRLSRASGVRPEIARGLEAFAELLACEGDSRGAVLLTGAAAGLREAAARRHTPHPDGPAHPSGTSVQRRPGHGARVEGMLEPIRRAMGEPVVAQWFDEGRSLAPDEAIALALGTDENDPEPATTTETPDPSLAAGGAFLPAEPAAKDPFASDASASGAASGKEVFASGGTAKDEAAPGGGAPSTLTAREREIARLVARGLSNKGIASELVISPATAARHVANILTKLGYNSRAQIAVWAVDHHLTDQPQLR
ncbi:LuxR C-terminal-related transcriptional regulator [Actinomadura rupiterrae]|uniref:LuxR C-terminal-related transcriptional regulator n=1 Tax=Actinomadura rupiterrae TaxID=559627 RepID=UPI0020A35051|nr:LuxR C-terminal-related transcriptional regulator [Actinomadura rupiterrae]MCP2336289.1 putative ATPase/DNA-binding CsgD family transcriptional regulator [Actinomadura rupiterrae]